MGRGMLRAHGGETFGNMREDNAIMFFLNMLTFHGFIKCFGESMNVGIGGWDCSVLEMLIIHEF